MPAKARKTDWKKLLADDGTPGTGGGASFIQPRPREILAAGTRSSEGNDGKFVPNRDRSDVLKMLETNRRTQAALRANKKKGYHPGLKGLFGGG